MKASHSTVNLTLVVSTLLLSPIFAGDVKTQTAKGADFAHYQIYEWLPPRVLTKFGEVENHPANPVIKEVVGRQLTQKGLREVANGADLQIQVTPQLEAVVYAFFPGDMSVSQVASIGRYNRAGTLYVNLIDRPTQKSAWVAMASESLPMGDLKPELIRAKLDSAAKNMFKKYPVKR